MWENMGKLGKHGKTWENMGKHGKTWENVFSITHIFHKKNAIFLTLH